MRHNCPHCNQSGISNLAVRWSSAGGPATCGQCGGLSHVIASISSGIAVATFLLAGTCIFIAAVLGSFLLGLLLACLVALPYNFWAWKRAELFPIFPENAANAKKVSWLLAIAYVLAAFIS